jgi:hypothetical protein
MGTVPRETHNCRRRQVYCRHPDIRLIYAVGAYEIGHKLFIFIWITSSVGAPTNTSSEAGGSP